MRVDERPPDPPTRTETSIRSSHSHPTRLEGQHISLSLSLSLVRGHIGADSGSSSTGGSSERE